MAVRADMAYIITFVRELIHDPSGSSQKFSDQQIQNRLDLNRIDVYQEELKEADTLASDGTIEWHDFWAKHTFWEEDFLIQQVDGDTVTPDVSEPLIGKFNFTAHQEEIPLLITGKAYNVYLVASLMLRTWIAEIRSQVSSWTADGTTIQKTQQVKNMRDLAQDYASRAWGWGNTGQIKLRRKDLLN